jgi:hypothetical protein
MDNLDICNLLFTNSSYDKYIDQKGDDMKNKLSTKKFFGVIAGLVVVLSLLAVAATPVFAKPLSPITVPVVRNNLTNDQLSSMLHHQQVWATGLRNGASFDGRTLAETWALIKDSEKINPSLSNKLDAASAREIRERMFVKNDKVLSADIARSRELDASVTNLIATHPGFSEDGSVTNSVLASQTVRSLNSYLTNLQYFLNHINSGLSKFAVSQ